MKITEGSYAANGSASPGAAPTPTAVYATYSYDGMGRVTDQLEYSSGTTVQYQRQVVYNDLARSSG